MDSEQIKPINKTIKHYKHQYRKNKTLKKHENNHNESTGGKVIDSGGYGCIFKPGLKCKPQSKSPAQNSNKSDISKLMLSHHATHEYNEITRFKHILETIPNYTDYYLLDGISLCEPSKLTKSDLKQYKRKCRALQKHNIQKTNINESLDKLLSLNMPYGGEDIGNYLRNVSTPSSLVNINESLIDLLNNGIIPMNKRNVYHCDVKESNILVKPRTHAKNGLKLYTRLIDWGLSTDYDKTKEQEIPKALSNRPFQYNLPFSVVLFNKRLHELYQEFLDETPNPDYSLMHGFATDYVILWLKERGMGHFKVIDEIVNYMFDKDEQRGGDKNHDYMNMKKYERTYNYISNYLAQILRKYTKNRELDLLDYFNNVFIKNVDVWGLVMSYLPILEELYLNYNKLNENGLNAFRKIKEIIIAFLFETATEPINVEDLTEELRELGSSFFHEVMRKREVDQNNDKNRKKTTSTILTDTSASV